MLESPIKSCLRVQLDLDEHPIHSCMNAQLVHAWAPDEFIPQVHHEFSPVPHWTHLVGFGIQEFQHSQDGRWPWTALCRLAAGSEAEMLSQNGRLSEDPTVQTVCGDAGGDLWSGRWQRRHVGKRMLHTQGMHAWITAAQRWHRAGQGDFECGHGWHMPAEWHWEAKGLKDI